MIKNIIRKLSVWSLSFVLVVTYLFIDIRIDFTKIYNSNKTITYDHTIDTEPMFNLIDIVTIQPNQEVFEVVEASLLATVVFYVAASVFMSLGAYYSSEFIRANASAFTSWYVDWYNSAPTLENGQTAEEIAQWNKAHEIPAYLEATGQLNPDGTLKDYENIVLMDDYVFNLYHSASYYLNDYVDAGGIKWMRYNYDGDIHLIPHINGYLIHETDTEIYSNTLKLNNVYSYPINKINYSVKVTEHLIGVDQYRMKMEVIDNSTNTVYITRYSATMTKYVRDTVIQAVGFIHTVYVDTTDWKTYLQLIPLYWNLDLADSMDYVVNFQYWSLESTTPEKITYDNSLKINTTNLIAVTYVDVELNEYGLPVGYDDDISDFYEIPIVDVTDDNPNPLPPTPLPVEDWPDYTYNPPVPGVGTGDWTDLVNPDTPAPTATPENTLSGGIFQALGDWFVSVFYGAINAVMGFFKAVLINMGTMISDLFDWWKQILPSTWFTDFWTEFADSMTGLFVPNDLDLKFNDLMDFFEQKLGLLLYPIQVITDIFNRFANVSGIDRITFNEFWLMGYLLIPAFYIDFGDMILQYSWLGYIFGLIKIFFTSLLIFQFLVFLYGTYESMRDA